jgi:chorismate dehydratase
VVRSQKRVGVSPHAYCLPVVEGLQEDAAFDLCVDVPTRNAIRLRQQELELAFLTPIDYARESSEYQIIPSVAVSSRQGNDTIVLHFREGLQTISTLAVDPSSTSEIILAKILLAEKFHVQPVLVPASGSLPEMLTKGDAALLVGDQALDVSLSHPNKLDLVEEWVDLVELPYVYGFWCGREKAILPEEILRLQQARDEGLRAIATRGPESARLHARHRSPESLKRYLESFLYDFTDEVRNAVGEFLRYAYYYGVLPDVADLHFYSTAAGDEPGRDEFSLN